MVAKSQKVEKNVDLIRAWQGETCLWNTFSPLYYKDRNCKTKSTKTLSEIFDMSGKYICFFEGGYS